LCHAVQDGFYIDSVRVPRVLLSNLRLEQHRQPVLQGLQARGRHVKMEKFC